MSAEQGKYVEVHWLLAGDDGIVRQIVVTGRVLGDEIRQFYAETATGEPVRIPTPFVVDALQDLVDAARGAS